MQNSEQQPNKPHQPDLHKAGVSGCHFYCQQLTGDVDFSIDEWNQTYNSIKDAGLTEAEENYILFGSREGCREQCFACMAIVGQRRLATKKLMDDSR